MGQGGRRSVGVVDLAILDHCPTRLLSAFARIVAPEIPRFGQDSDRGD